MKTSMKRFVFMTEMKLYLLKNGAQSSLMLNVSKMGLIFPTKVTFQFI